jgi:16S rRNA (cytosine1402-N4)-methyltransferase
MAFDRDPEAIAAAPRQIQTTRALPSATPASATWRAELAALGITQVDGVLLDLGVSSPQIDNPERGFSFRFDAPLDMRMDTTRGETAADFLARADERHIEEVIRDHGEERFAFPIAKALVARREAGLPFEPQGSFPRSWLVQSRPASRARTLQRAHFKALRIFVNAELEALEQGLNAALALLAPQGRLVVISFHSLEDRIVKTFIARESRDVVDRRAPLAPPKPLRLRALGRIKPGDGETARQPARALGGDARGRAHRGAGMPGCRQAGGEQAQPAPAGAAAGQQPVPGEDRLRSRRLFARWTAPRSRAAQLDTEFKRLDAERQAQATHLRVEKVAREKLRMRTATPASRSTWPTPAASGGRDDRGRQPQAERGPRRRHQRAQRQLRHQPAAGQQDAALALALHRGAGGPGLCWCCWAARVWLQIIGTDFYQKEGEKRFAHTLPCRPAAAASSTATAWCWPPACRRRPVGRSRKDFKADTAQRKASWPGCWACRGRAGRAARSARPNFAWLRRQVDEPVWQQVKALGIKGVYQEREYKRKYPEGEAAAHVVGFTNVEDKGQEGIELRFDDAAARARRLAHRGARPPGPRGRGHRRPVDPVNGRDMRCPSTPRCSSSPTSACATRCASTTPRPAAWWCWTCRPARCWRWPTTPATTPASGATSPARSCATAR